MSGFNDSLDQCLVELYDYSSNFKVNIELIQKLAQQLKLDTFIDKDAYSHIFDPNLKTADTTPKKFQRLSIAGSVILIDIDFTDVDKIIKVSLSLANQGTNTEGTKQEFDLDSQICPPEIDKEGHNVVRIDYMESGLSFLTKCNDKYLTLAEEILLSNLQPGKLGYFPGNLKYLATLDRMSSSSDLDLFSYLDKIALVLQAIYLLETKKNSNWLFEDGLYTCIGKISMNDSENSKLGVFIDFWKDFRFINHELESKGSNKYSLGKSFRALIDTDTVDTSQKDYLEQNNDALWKLVNEKGDLESYKFVFNNDSNRETHSSNPIIAKNPKGTLNWNISLRFNHSITLPIQIIEFLGVTNYIRANEVPVDSDILMKLNETKECNCDLNLSTESSLKLRITQQLAQEYIPISSLSINSLSSISQLIPILRNYVVLSNLLRTMIKEYTTNTTAFVGVNGTYGKSNELTTETKNRLKASLKLPEDVTNEELMGLSAFSDNNTAFSSMQLNKPNEVDLDNFMNEESIDTQDGLGEQIQDPIEGPYLYFSIDDIDYSSSFYDLSLTLNGLLPSASGTAVEFEVRFKISNGIISEISLNSNDEDTDMDKDNEKIKKNESFTKGLNLTENIVKVLQYVYLD